MPKGPGREPRNKPICEGGKGLLLPLGGKFEEDLDPRLKILVYFLGMIYFFLAVSIAADMFMDAIERITSKKRVVRNPHTKGNKTTFVWNDTIANLTLMALGSSAPEILLSLNDVLKNEFFEGKLGPSTIVGSAAFNLFVIIAVCINSVPEGEVRQIKETGVFFITAAFSILAYAWLLVIVQFNSRDIIEVWEGVLTFAFFPLLVFISYSSDVGWLSKENCLNCMASLCSFGNGAEADDDASDDGTPVLSCVCQAIGSATRGILTRLRGGSGKAVKEEGGDDQLDVENTDALIVDEGGNPVDNEAGILTFKSDSLEVAVGEERREFTIPVYRKNGTDGRVSCKYRMEGLTSAPGYDYVEETGTLNYRDGITTQEIVVTILPKRAAEKSDQFQLILEEPTNGLIFSEKSDGYPEKALLTVTIKNESAAGRKFRNRVIPVIDGLVNLGESRLGTELWRAQIMEAVYVKGSKEEQDNAGFGDWIIHVIWLPWKATFAVATPPPTYMGGWICFWVSLLHIGWLTILIGDLAELFGCAAGIDDSVTAITFVALGTSVPDLFASRAAAKQDEYADASIVNVTGSNSVNVFLGIGLPWMWAAIYWKVQGPNDQWRERYGEEYGSLCPDGCFIVRAGDIAFTVAAFTLGACVCLSVIRLRRIVYGGELGGPPDVKAYSSCLLVLLWFGYIALSIWKYSGPNSDDIGKQLLAVGISIPALILCMFIFGGILKLLKFSKKYIGEEGFWGIFVAATLFTGRIVAYFAFQYEW